MQDERRVSVKTTQPNFILSYFLNLCYTTIVSTMCRIFPYLYWCCTKVINSSSLLNIHTHRWIKQTYPDIMFYYIKQCIIIVCTYICSCVHMLWWLQCLWWLFVWVMIAYSFPSALDHYCYPGYWQCQKSMAYLGFMAGKNLNTS